MVASTTQARAGRPAVMALAEAIGRAKGDDPLAPVTVVVPTGYSGLSLRRLLGGGLVPAGSGGRRGLANVGFLTARGLATQLGSPAMSAEGRRPLTAALRTEALRATLAGGPGLFAAVAEHPATEAKLDRTFAELRPCPDEVLDRLAMASARARAIVSAYRSWRERIAAWYDEHDLCRAAVAALATGSTAAAELGHVVVYCPSPDDDVAEQLIEALGSRATHIAAVLAPPPPATAIISASDADEEARAVVRRIWAAAHAGTPFHRMAITYGPTDPYRRLVHRHLTVAGVPAAGPGILTLAERVTGRTLLGLLELGAPGSATASGRSAAEAALRRDDVMAWLAAAPIRDPATAKLVPTSAWDTLSRRAGVVAGTAQWHDRLGREREARESRREAVLEGEEADQAAVERYDTELDRLAGLQRFVSELANDLRPPEPRTWAAFATWAGGLLDRYLGSPSAWPEREQTAHAAVLAALGRLADLDALGTAATLVRFHRAAVAELQASAGASGSFGHGVFVGPLSLLAGVDVDVVFVLGLAEGVLPGRPNDDALLPAAEREVAGGRLASRAGRVADQQRHYLNAAAAGQERVLVFPRSDLRRTRNVVPSRWLLEAAASLTGREVGDRPPGSDELDQLLVAGAGDVPARTLTTVASFPAGVSAAVQPASRDELDLAELASWTSIGGDLSDHPLASAGGLGLGAGVRAIRARATAELTAFDGQVSSIGLPGSSPDAPVSATSLEQYATCPRRYFLGKVLSVGSSERPEEIAALSPLERGSRIHLIVERFIQGVIEGEPRSLERLLEIAEAEFEDVEAAGLTGRPLRWQYERQLIRRELRRFYAEDRFVPIATELGFGSHDEPAVTVGLPGGAQVNFRGRIDRVDDDGHGGLVVTDYKTGRAKDTKLLEESTVARGTQLQLPLYGRAARQRLAPEGTPVRVRYWYISERGNFTEAGYVLDDERWATFEAAVGTIVTGVTEGRFPGRPGSSDWRPDGESWENCRYCDFDRLCPTDRAKQWDLKRDTPSLTDYVALAE